MSKKLLFKTKYRSFYDDGTYSFSSTELDWKVVDGLVCGTYDYTTEAFGKEEQEAYASYLAHLVVEE